MPGSRLFNLGLFQKNFNSTSRVTGPAINMGSTRGIGSTTRMFNYCKQQSSTPSLCINQFITINESISQNVPEAPIIISIISGDRQLTVNFEITNEGSSPLIEYIYNDGTGDSSFVPTNNSFVINNLTNGVQYGVKIQVYNSFGPSKWSSISTGTPTAPTKWTNLPPGLDGDIYCSATDIYNTIYVGGSTNLSINGIQVNGLAKWNGLNWSSIDLSITSGSMYAIAIKDSNIYIGGDFSNNIVSKIARYDKTTNSLYGLGELNNYVTSIAFGDSGNIYVGGVFTSAGGVNANRIAMLNGTDWTSLGGGITSTISTGSVQSIVYHSSILYVGGSFTDAGGISVSNVAKWDGSNWSSLGSLGWGPDGNVLTLSICGDYLYTGGVFDYVTTDTSIKTKKIARYNIKTLGWSGLNMSGDSFGLNNYVRSISTDMYGNIYIGGDFTQVVYNRDNLAVYQANHIIQYNGFSFTKLETGVGVPGDFVNSIVFDLSGNVIAVGKFSEASGVAVKNIAKYMI